MKYKVGDLVLIKTCFIMSGPDIPKEQATTFFSGEKVGIITHIYTHLYSPHSVSSEMITAEIVVQGFPEAKRLFSEYDFIKAN